MDLMRRREHLHTTDATITRVRFYSVACTQWILKLNFFMQTWKDFTITIWIMEHLHKTDLTITVPIPLHILNGSGGEFY